VLIWTGFYLVYVLREEYCTLLSSCIIVGENFTAGKSKCTCL